MIASDSFCCWSCGASIAQLSLPLTRLDECPACTAQLHVCRMCVSFDATRARSCREEGADDVREKERANFCDWFRPRSGAFDADAQLARQRAGMELAALFGSSADNPAAADNSPGDAAATDPDRLFGK